MNFKISEFLSSLLEGNYVIIKFIFQKIIIHINYFLYWLLNH